MSEQLNQVESEVNDFNEDSMFDFEDLTGESIEEQSESDNLSDLPEDENNEASNEDNQEGNENDYLEIVYNGERKKVTKEEAITLAQKGMNYDKVTENLQNLRNSQELQMLNQMASESGMNPVEYLERLQGFQNESLINRVQMQLRAKYPDAPEELIRSNAEAYVNQQMQSKAEESYRTQQIEQDRQNEFINQQIDLFAKKYPDVDIAKLPIEVVEKMREGTGLVAAYQDYENTQLRKEIETLKLNNKNKTVSPGSLKGNQSSENESDPFLQGFFGK